MYGRTVVDAIAYRMVFGEVLQAGNVTAGNGVVIDWRTTRSGFVVLSGATPEECASSFVQMVGRRRAAYLVRETS